MSHARYTPVAQKETQLTILTPEEKEPTQTTSPPRTWGETIRAYLPNFVSKTLGFGANLPCAQYAMAVPKWTPSEVSLPLFESLSLGSQLLWVYTGTSTVLISGLFGANYLGIAAQSIKKDALEFIRERKNTKRFLTALTVSFWAALTGSTVSADPYEGSLKVIAGTLSFIFNGAISFVTVSKLFTYFFDQDATFQDKVLSQLKSINPDYYGTINKLIQGKKLNEQSIGPILCQIFTLGQEFQQSPIPPFFVAESSLEQKKRYFKNSLNTSLATLIAIFSAPPFMQAGFKGTNQLTGGALTTADQAAKIVLGMLAGAPTSLFVLLGTQNFIRIVGDIYPELELKNNPRQLVKFMAYLALLIGNSFWVYSLGKTTVTSENIFSLSANDQFGMIEPYIAAVGAVLMGAEGTARFFFPKKEKPGDPEIKDIINWVSTKPIPKETISSLKLFSIFSQNESKSIELIEDQKAENGFSIA